MHRTPGPCRIGRFSTSLLLRLLSFFSALLSSLLSVFLSGKQDVAPLRCRRPPVPEVPRTETQSPKRPLLCWCLDPRGPCGGSLPLYGLCPLPLREIPVCLSAGLLLQHGYAFAGYCALCDGGKPMVNTLWLAIGGLTQRQLPSAKMDRISVPSRRVSTAKLAGPLSMPAQDSLALPPTRLQAHHSCALTPRLRHHRSPHRTARVATEVSQKLLGRISHLLVLHVLRGALVVPSCPVVPNSPVFRAQTTSRRQQPTGMARHSCRLLSQPVLSSAIEGGQDGGLPSRQANPRHAPVSSHYRRPPS